MAREHIQTCPIARVLNLLGDSWTLMIVREALYGATRFSEIQANTGIAKNLLASRLIHLVEQGVLEKENTGENGTRYEYKITTKGQSLNTIMIAMHQWGNEHEFHSGNEPVLLIDTKTGNELEKMLPRRLNGEIVNDQDIELQAGPGASRATIKRMLAAAAAKATTVSPQVD